ncbi:MAG: hypothetical protein FWE01_00085 [Firmicutes bacterium]|nr:hypothetical protein [Bacillota bacterium]
MVVTIFMWSMFGAFIIAIFSGIMWGIKRGFKKSLFRFGTISIAILLAFFLAPPIAGLFANVPIPGVTDGMGLRTWINYQATSNIDGTSNFPELLAFLSALPIAIASLVVFFGLLLLFRFIAWIFFIIFANKVAPNQVKVYSGDKTANGMEKFELQDAKKRRILGALVGGITAFIIFLFMFIPVNGAIDTLNRITAFNPSIQTTAPVKMFDDDINPIANVTRNLHDTNRDIQRSPYGIVSRYTGLQWLSGSMFGYLTTVRTRGNLTNINLRNDAITASQTLTDFVAINQNFFDNTQDDESSNRRSFASVINTLDDVYFELAEHMINNVFTMNLTRLLTSSMQGFATFLGENIISELDLFGNNNANDSNPYQYISGYEESALSLNSRFNNALVSAISLMDHNFLRNDLIQSVRIIRHLFSPVYTPVSTDLSLFDGLQGIINNISSINNLDELSYASDDFGHIIAPREVDNIRSSPLYDLLTDVFELGLFSTILTNENIELETEIDMRDILFVPLIHYIGLTHNDLDGIVFGNWSRVAYDLTYAIIVANEAITVLSEFINNINEFLNTINDLDLNDLESVANLLDLVTQELPIGPQVGNLVYRLLDDANLDLSEFSPEVEDAFNTLMYDLREGNQFNWGDRLLEIQNAFGV